MQSGTSASKLIPELPELLAPAGDHDCVRAAVENGANAIYLGLDDGFNARARATNFVLDAIPDLMSYLHQRDVRGYITLNTLAFSDELGEVETIARRLAAAHVDAVLVQDVGVARLIRETCPDLTLHASTQMTLTSAECIDAIAELGIARVVLARELSLDEIRAIHQATPMPLEVFVHGALCVAYSGQCLTSESLGGRSANRGQCAQACRLPYELVVDGVLTDLGDQKYLLSPQDLAAFDLIPELIQAGVCSFKIEGRLKTPEYVANITRHYREAIDRAVAGLPIDFSKRRVQQMEQSFSRGFSPGWLKGCDHKMLVPATSSSKRGVLLGHVVRVGRDRVTVDLIYDVAAGDGVVFEGDRVSGSEQGGRVFDVFVDGVRQDQPVESGMADLTFDHRNVDLSQLRTGLKIWKTDDPRLNQQLRRTFSSADAVRRVGLNLTVVAEVGSPLTIHGVAETGAECSVQSEQTLEVADRHPLTAEVLRKQLGRLGATIFELRELQATIVGGPIVPHSVLGQLRRQMVEQLQSGPPWIAQRIAEHPVLPRMRSALSAGEGRRNESGFGAIESRQLPLTLNVMCRTPAQLQALTELQAVESDPDLPRLSAYADFADIREYREAVDRAGRSQWPLFLATPRIQKPGETGIFRAMLRHQPDGVLVRNLSGLKFFRDHNIPVIADFSLNVTNELTAEFLMNQQAERLTASYDLNRDQLLSLVRLLPPAWLEVVIHQHMPMFHMEHCVFCAVISPGTNKTNCGRPCDVHQVELKDRLGLDHPLTADVGCRNTLYNSVPQSSAEIVHELLSLGIRQFRVELLRQTAAEVGPLVELYQQLLTGAVSGRSVWKQLNAVNQVGVTRGTLESRRNPLAIL